MKRRHLLLHHVCFLALLNMSKHLRETTWFIAGRHKDEVASCLCIYVISPGKIHGTATPAIIWCSRAESKPPDSSHKKKKKKVSQEMMFDLQASEKSQDLSLFSLVYLSLSYSATHSRVFFKSLASTSATEFSGHTRGPVKPQTAPRFLC